MKSIASVIHVRMCRGFRLLINTGQHCWNPPYPRVWNPHTYIHTRTHTHTRTRTHTHTHTKTQREPNTFMMVKRAYSVILIWTEHEPDVPEDRCVYLCVCVASDRSVRRCVRTRCLWEQMLGLVNACSYWSLSQRHLFFSQYIKNLYHYIWRI